MQITKNPSYYTWLPRLAKRALSAASQLFKWILTPPRGYIAIIVILAGALGWNYFFRLETVSLQPRPLSSSPAITSIPDCDKGQLYMDKERACINIPAHARLILEGKQSLFLKPVQAASVEVTEGRLSFSDSQQHGVIEQGQVQFVGPGGVLTPLGFSRITIDIIPQISPDDPKYK